MNVIKNMKISVFKPLDNAITLLSTFDYNQNPQSIKSFLRYMN